MSWSYWLTSLQFPDDVEAITDGEEDRFNTGIGDDEVVEGDDALCLFVFRDRFLPEFPVPKHVIGKDEATRPYQIEDQIVVGDIFTFVGIHVNNVVGAFQCGKGLAGVADVQGDLVRHPGP